MILNRKELFASCRKSFGVSTILLLNFKEYVNRTNIEFLANVNDFHAEESKEKFFTNMSFEIAQDGHFAVGCGEDRFQSKTPTKIQCGKEQSNAILQITTIEICNQK